MFNRAGMNMFPGNKFTEMYFQKYVSGRKYISKNIFLEKTFLGICFQKG